MSITDSKQYSVDTRDLDGKPIVEGFESERSYYTGTAWFKMKMSSLKDAENAADMANNAWRDGYLKAKAEIRKALGIAE